MTFNELNIIEPILKALALEGYTSPSPIQEQAIPVLLSGKDLLGTAQTGTGKTAAYAIPIIQQIFSQKNTNEKKLIKALILAPTRELAIQIGDNIKIYSKYLGLKTTVIFGGVSQGSQTRALTAGVDILVATPGRLLDLMKQRFVNLSNVEYFVLDEADRMLDMGFIHDVDYIVGKIPAKRQTMLFSATLPKSIIQYAEKILNNPVEISVTPVSQTIDVINQKVYIVRKQQKFDLLAELLKGNEIDSALVFSRTKHGANKIVTQLKGIGIIAEAIHGNKSQSAREFALRRFKNKEIKVLIATDIAARGIDINKLSHVINYDLPDVPETYIHRIGRTGRAGEEGTAISFCSAEETNLLKEIEKHIGMTIDVATTPFLLNNSREKEIIQTKENHQQKQDGVRKPYKAKDNQQPKKNFSNKKFDKSESFTKAENNDPNSRKGRYNKPKKSFSNNWEYRAYDNKSKEKSYVKFNGINSDNYEEPKITEKSSRNKKEYKPYNKISSEKSHSKFKDKNLNNGDHRNKSNDRPVKNNNGYKPHDKKGGSNSIQIRDYSNVRTYHKD